MEMPYVIKLSCKEPVSDVDTPQAISSTAENHIETSSPQDSFSECGQPLAKESSKDIFPVAEHHFNNAITSHSKFSSDKEPLCEKNSSQNNSHANRILSSETPSSSQDFSSVDDESLPRPSSSQNKVQAGKKPFVCNICQKGFKFKRNFDSHRHSHVHDKKQFCELCQRTFLHRMAYNNHSCVKNAKKNAEKNKSLECNICGQKFVKEHLYLCHLEMHNEKSNAPLVCGKCKKEFTDKPSLNRHMDSHIPLRSDSFECNVCHDKFPSKYYMTKHFFHKHTNFLKCETCGRRFPDRDKLSSHRKNSHTTCDHLQMHNEKSDTPLVCKKCKKEFTDKPSLMHHMDTHIPVRSNSVECKICHDKFPSRHFMKKHITEKHTNFFICETCGRRFQDSIRLSSHKQNVHTICGICEKRFLTNRDLSEHINYHRNDQILMNESLK